MKIFVEEQRMTSWWIHAILILSIGVPILLMGEQLYTEETVDGDLQIAAVILLVTMLGVYGLIFSMRLKTRIDEVGIHFQFSPFQRSLRTVHWTEISEVSVRKYRALIEYGGWGIRSRGLKIRHRGIAYTMQGNKGIQLVLTTGKKILIGTQNPEDAKKTLKTYEAKCTTYEN